MCTAVRCLATAYVSLFFFFPFPSILCAPRPELYCRVRYYLGARGGGRNKAAGFAGWLLLHMVRHHLGRGETREYPKAINDNGGGVLLDVNGPVACTRARWDLSPTRSIEIAILVSGTLGKTRLRLKIQLFSTHSCQLFQSERKKKKKKKREARVAQDYLQPHNLQPIITCPTSRMRWPDTGNAFLFLFLFFFSLESSQPFCARVRVRRRTEQATCKNSLFHFELCPDSIRFDW